MDPERQSEKGDFLTAIHPRDQMYSFLLDCLRQQSKVKLGDAHTKLVFDRLREGGVTDHGPSDDESGPLNDVERAAVEHARFVYFRTAHEILQTLQNALRAAGKNLSSFPSVLEFACGYGRFTRHLINKIDRSRVWVSEIQPQALEFVKSTFAVEGFLSTTQPESLCFPRTYDLIYVVSLFTHLPAHRFRSWLRRLYEALEPDGLLILTTHGPSRGQAGDPDFAYRPQSEIESLDSREYGSTCIAPSAMRQISAECGIQHLYGIERDLGNVQDVYVASRQPLPGLRNWKRTPLIQGYLDGVTVGRDGLNVCGWAASLGEGLALPEVQFLVDGRSCATTAVDKERRDVVAVTQRPDWLVSGFEAVIPKVPAGRHSLIASARLPCGEVAGFDMLSFRTSNTGGVTRCDPWHH